MSGLPLIFLLVAIGLFLLGMLLPWAAWRKKKEGKQQTPNYRSLFILGATFLSLGIIYEVVFFVSDVKAFLVLGLAFMAMGLSYLAIGLANRTKWTDSR